jgi:hypothetical protein
VQLHFGAAPGVVLQRPDAADAVGIQPEHVLVRVPGRGARYVRSQPSPAAHVVPLAFLARLLVSQHTLRIPAARLTCTPAPPSGLHPT